MSRWLLALLFAFGSVSFLAACEEKSDLEKATDDAEDVADDVADDVEDIADDVVPE